MMGSCEQIIDNFGFHKRNWFVFRAGEFLMASKEVLCRMQLVRIRLLLCVDEHIFWGEWSILTEAQPNSRTGALAEEWWKQERRVGRK